MPIDPTTDVIRDGNVLRQSYRPRFSLKTLLGITTVVAVLVAFYHIRSQPRLVADRFQAYIEARETDAALSMITGPSLSEQLCQRGFERLTLVSFHHDNPSMTHWFLGKRQGLLKAETSGRAGEQSALQWWDCSVEITSRGLRIADVESTDISVMGPGGPPESGE